MNTIVKTLLLSLFLTLSLGSATHAQTPTKVEHKGMVYVLENGKWVVTQGEATASSISALKDGKYTIYKAIRIGPDHSLEVQKLGKWSKAVGQSIAVDDIKYKFENGQWIVSDGIRLTNNSEIEVKDGNVWVVKSKKAEPVATETPKEACLKSKNYWLDHYPGKNKCFTEKEDLVFRNIPNLRSCRQQGYFWQRVSNGQGVAGGFCSTFDKGVEYCKEESKGDFLYYSSRLDRAVCGSLEQAEQYCTHYEHREKYNAATGHCEGQVIMDIEAKRNKDRCRQSGFNWVEAFTGSDKCLTGQESDVYQHYQDYDYCSRTGNFWLNTGAVFAPYFCTTFHKGRDICKALDPGHNSSYLYDSPDLKRATCSSLKSAEDYCAQHENGKKYDPTTGFCK